MSNYCYYCMKEYDGGACPHCGRAACEPPVHHLPPGIVLNGRYMIGSAIGEGGFGITYIGKDLNLDMLVAVKEFFPVGRVYRNNTDSTITVTATGGNEDFLKKGKLQFINEARVLAKFSGNKSIVDVRDYFESNNTAYIVMEYIQGITLSRYIKSHGVFETEDLFSRMLPIFNALRLIHAQGLIHRDISPDNIMILDDGSLKLMDFGAARDVNFEDKRSLSIVLRQGYAPVEQYRSKGVQGPWTDIYAICATIYKCVTGVTPDESMERVFADELKRPSELGIKIPAEYEAALMKGLSVYQDERYQSVDELLSDLVDSSAYETSGYNYFDGTSYVDSEGVTSFFENSETATTLVDSSANNSAFVDEPQNEQKKSSPNTTEDNNSPIFKDYKEYGANVEHTGKSKPEEKRELDTTPIFTERDETGRIVTHSDNESEFELPEVPENTPPREVEEEAAPVPAPENKTRKKGAIIAAILAAVFILGIVFISIDLLKPKVIKTGAELSEAFNNSTKNETLNLSRVQINFDDEDGFCELFFDTDNRTFRVTYNITKNQFNVNSGDWIDCTVETNLGKELELISVDKVYSDTLPSQSVEPETIDSTTGAYTRTIYNSSEMDEVFRSDDYIGEEFRLLNVTLESDDEYKRVYIETEYGSRGYPVTVESGVPFDDCEGMTVDCTIRSDGRLKLTLTSIDVI